MTTEVDAYCFSTVASYCTAALGNLVEEQIVATGTPTTGKSKPIAALNKAFVFFANHEVPIKNQVAFCSPDFINALRESDEVTKFLAQEDFKEGKDINFQILNYQGRKLVEVSPDRLRTNVILGAEGYSWAANSEGINFLMVDKTAVIHVVKYEKVKVIGDDLNLAGNGFDGYTIYARIYHDVFVPDNKRYGLYCSVNVNLAKMAVTLDILVQNYKIKAITTFPGEKLCYVGTLSSEKSVGGTLTNWSELTLVDVGEAVDDGKVYYAVDPSKTVIAKRAALEVKLDTDSKVTAFINIINDADIKYKKVAATTAPTSYTAGDTDIEVGDAIASVSSTNNSYVYAYKGTTFLGAVKVADHTA